jgi:hypothetical protein
LSSHILLLLFNNNVTKSQSLSAISINRMSQIPRNLNHKPHNLIHFRAVLNIQLQCLPTLITSNKNHEAYSTQFRLHYVYLSVDSSRLRV